MMTALCKWPAVLMTLLKAGWVQVQALLGMGTSKTRAALFLFLLVGWGVLEQVLACAGVRE